MRLTSGSAISPEAMASDNAIPRGQRHANHIWTQMNTDTDHPKPRFPMVTIRSPDSDPKLSEGSPESGPQNLCLSVSICVHLWFPTAWLLRLSRNPRWDERPIQWRRRFGQGETDA